MGTIKKTGRRRRPTVEDLFSSLEDPHPYGVLPGGNRFFDESAYATKKRSEEIFPDSLWQQILSFCDGSALARVVQTSRYLYVAGHQPELWRDLVLRRCETENRVIDSAKHSWKDTYASLFSKNKQYQPHQPIHVPGIYSDHYYRTHLCRSFNLPPVWLEGDDETTPNVVPLVESLTPEQFLESYEEPNSPVVIKGGGKTHALDKWSDPKYMLEYNANKSFRATSGAAPLPADFTLQAYQEYSQTFSYLEESPLYLFDRTAFADNPQWSEDFFPEFYKTNPHWNPKRHSHDLLQHLGEGRRPDHTWLIMGPQRSGSVFHIDPNATHAWNVCIRGRKRWIFYPPGVNPPGVFPSADGDEVALPLSVGEWLLQYWQEHTDQYKKPLAERPMECTVHPGDAIFVPHGWWHAVINLDSQNIAITHNYVSPSNMGNVLKFFSVKQDQISGCRDRKESVKPEHLRQEFVKVLQEKEPIFLEKALEQKEWTCRAWNNNDKNGVADVPDLVTPSRGEDGDNSCVSGTKRPNSCIDSENTEEEEQQRKSVMAKTEKVSAFTFSFL